MQAREVAQRVGLGGLVTVEAREAEGAPAQHLHLGDPAAALGIGKEEPEENGEMTGPATTAITAAAVTATAVTAVTAVTAAVALDECDDVLRLQIAPGEGVLAAGEGRDRGDLRRVLGRLCGGGATAVVLVDAGFDDRGEDALGDGGVPAQGDPGDVIRTVVAGDLPGELAHQVVRGVAAVRGLLQQGHVDEAVEGGLGAALVGVDETGEQRCAVRGQIQGTDAAQRESRVPVGLAVGGGERVVGDGEGTPHTQVVVLQVVQPPFGGGQLAGKRVGGEGAPGGQPGGDDTQGPGEDGRSARRGGGRRPVRNGCRARTPPAAAPRSPPRTAARAGSGGHRRAR